jgi:DNA-binding NarL/FixJ family response regulator
MVRRSSQDGRTEPLTPREQEILQLFARGLGTTSIAKRLSISPVTVRNHAQRILAKLGVHSRLAAVARGYSLRLIVLQPGGRETSP